MGMRTAGVIAAVSAAGLIGGAGLVGHGAEAETTKQAAEPKAGETYTFVDHDRTPNAQIVSYRLPPLPAGAYSVSLFAGLEPKETTPDENLYCQVSDTTKAHRILVATAHWRDSAATFVSGSSAVRLDADNALWVLCEGEHGKITYSSDPLRITFVRLASMKATSVSPE